MSEYIPRIADDQVQDSLKRNPVTALLGPRQCGKSTLVKNLTRSRDDVIYLDLERPSDLQKLDDAEWFLQSQSDKLVCLDEIQRKQDLFPVIRSIVDSDRKAGRFLILGSASRDLIRQSSESLAGRISYKKLTPFLWAEVEGKVTLEEYLNRGGFPLSLLAPQDNDAYEWRIDFISTFLERDLLQFAGFTTVTMSRLWQMLAHNNGQTLNLSKIGESLGVSHTTVRHYVDLLEGTFMVTQLRPWSGNAKKRVVKTPKVYICDTGLTAALLQLRSFDQLAGHPVFGSLWEAAVLAQIRAWFPDAGLSFYRSSHGHEIDILITHHEKIISIECKASLSPALNASFYKAAEDVKPGHVLVAAPVDHGYPMKKGIDVVSLSELPEKVRSLL
ncbi:ATP-binding protein [Rhodohalobacter mucosus]|uniref:ATP-binding protein n=1 Tax=Rhodohalobacter mucosus TaxID=2079485 RepID=A0A316TLK2_9BACT|nr:ATP-binding protein [Rhodohalobacter mucosus]PWN05447.1 ATP-binding protein [Rhodohalobacter mucosus]